MRDYKGEIAKQIGVYTKIDEKQIYSFVEKPPQPFMGDYAFPCFKLSKELRKSPVKVAEELQEALEDKLDFTESIEVKNGYLNFFIYAPAFIHETVTNAISEESKIGSSDEGKGKTVLVEFSSPNIAKPFHVGHGFTTVLGNVLNNLYVHLGYNTVRINHLGDYGTQFGKLISAYKRWGDEEKLKRNPIDELLRIYVKFHEEAKNNPELEEEARNYFLKLEKKSPEEMELWEKFRELSLKEFSKQYEKLGVGFDDYTGESFYSDKIDEVIQILEQKGLLVESEGAKVVMLEEFNLPPCIIVKSDGTSIYASRDIAAVLHRIKKYDFYKNLYVVGNPQSMHFKQVFAVVGKMGFPHAKNCEHVGFGLVKFKDMKFSTREGNIVLLEKLYEECISKTFEIIKANNIERNTKMTTREMEQTAEKIGIGAVVYTFCKNSRERDIVFSWDEMLNFEGDSAPYIMYTYARCQSILRKAQDSGIKIQDPAGKRDFKNAQSGEEYNLIKLIYAMGESIRDSVKANEPYILVRQINSIARAFNKFYNNSPILSNSDTKVRNARLNICRASANSLYAGMKLLGISPVERM